METSEADAMSYAARLPLDQQQAFTTAWRASKKDKGTAMLLSALWLLGFAGVGRMYIGQTMHGLMLLFLGPVTCFIWPLVDMFMVGGAVEQINQDTLRQLQLRFPPI